MTGILFDRAWISGADFAMTLANGAFCFALAALTSRAWHHSRFQAQDKAPYFFAFLCEIAIALRPQVRFPIFHFECVVLFVGHAFGSRRWMRIRNCAVFGHGISLAHFGIGQFPKSTLGVLV